MNHIIRHLNNIYTAILLRIRIFYGKVRRQFIIFFMHDYIERQKTRRSGSCRQCAICCNLAYRCPLLARHNFCRIYSIGRPRVCSLSPINQNDIDDIKALGGECGYKFN